MHASLIDFEQCTTAGLCKNRTRIFWFLECELPLWGSSGAGPLSLIYEAAFTFANDLF